MPFMSQAPGSEAQMGSRECEVPANESKLLQGGQYGWSGISRDGTEVVADKDREIGGGQVL